MCTSVAGALRPVAFFPPKPYRSGDLLSRAGHRFGPSLSNRDDSIGRSPNARPAGLPPLYSPSPAEWRSPIYRSLAPRIYRSRAAVNHLAAARLLCVSVAKLMIGRSYSVSQYSGLRVARAAIYEAAYGLLYSAAKAGIPLRGRYDSVI